MEVNSTKEQRDAYREVMNRISEFMASKHTFERQGFIPTGVLLPKRLNHPFTGEGATDNKALFMNLPVTWSEDEEWALIFHLPKGK